MKRKKLMLIVVAAGLILLSLTACDIHLNFNRTADMAKHMAGEIADFDLPNGYKAVFSGTYNEYTLLAYNNTNNVQSHIYLLQSENPGDLAVFQHELEGLMPEKIQSGSDVKVIETSAITVRGADAVKILTEGVNADNQDYRQVVVFFEGKSGPAALVLSELTSDWDDARAEQLIGSID